MNQFENISNHLIKCGFNVFAPGVHEGLVKEPYIVVKPSNSEKYATYSTQICYYDLLLYTRTVSEMIQFYKQVVEAMKEIQPMIMSTYDQQEPYYDSDVKGWMFSIMYRNYKKIDY